MKKILSVALVLLLWGCGLGSASAQTATSYKITITNTVTGILTTAVLVGSPVCNQTPKIPVTASTVNASRVVWDDETNPTTADCIWTDPGTGPLMALPFGPTSYTAVIVASNSAGDSPASAASLPFTKPGAVPAARTGVRVIR